MRKILKWESKKYLKSFPSIQTIKLYKKALKVGQIKFIKCKKKTKLKQKMVQTGKNRFTGHPKLIYPESQMFLPGFQTIQE
jgi:hypothetical protein